MAKYKEISMASTQIERIKLNSKGCNLNLVSISVTILLMLYFCYDSVLENDQELLLVSSLFVYSYNGVGKMSLIDHCFR